MSYSGGQHILSMVALRHFRHPIGPFERSARRLYSDTLRRLGFVPHVMRAQGARFVVDPSYFIDRCIAHFGMWEEAQLEDLAGLARRHRIDVFLDIGANSGFYSVMFAVKNLAERIIAFEPDPGNYARLMANLKANDLAGRVEAVPFAIGDADSEVTLFEGARYNRGESTIVVPEQTPQEVKFQVRQQRFDDAYAIAGKTLIVKMDVEGYEFQALAGMERTLGGNACYMQIEHYGDRHEELKARMAGLGYRYLHTHDIDLFFTNMPDIG
jgi:FkbM family methyltransferase